MQATILLRLIIIQYAIAIITSSLSTAHAFTSPAITLQKSTNRSKRHLLMAAKKKGKKNNTNAKKRRSGNTAPSGKGFGQNESSSAIVPATAAAVADTNTDSAKTDSINANDAAAASHSSSIHSNLLNSLTQNPTTFISPKFTISPSALGGYGGFANASISKDELLFRIPRECCVTQDDALNDADCGEAFRLIQEKKAPSWGMVLLAGYIAKEHLLAREYCEAAITTMKGGDRIQVGEDRIKHWAYYQSVPWKEGGTLEQNHILFWSDDEIENLLGGSLAYDDAMLIRKTVESAERLLADFVVPIVHRVRTELRERDPIHEEIRHHCDDVDHTDIRKRLKQAVKGAFVITLSRSFAEEVELGYNGAIQVENLLLPLIDILQHSNTPNTMLEPYDDYVIVRANRDVDVGEELFHRYQEEIEAVIPPYKFFTRYGFVPGVRDPIEELLKGQSGVFFDLE